MSRPAPHELEREQAFLRGLAVVAASYYEALVAEGLSAPFALMLARDWHAHFLAVTCDHSSHHDA